MTRTYDDFFHLFDEIFSDSVRFFETNRNQQPIRFNKVVSSSQFPPADIFCNQKTKELTIRVALAGYSKNDINLSFDGDYLKLIAERPDDTKDVKEGETITELVIQRGIKLPRKVECSWIIDPRYYSRDNVDVSYEDGLLKIVISPREDVAPKTISLFGNLDLSKKENKEIEEKE